MTTFGIGAGAALAKRLSGVRNDPYLGFNFLVEIQGMLAGGFTQVSGLGATTDVETVVEGGANSTAYKLPKRTSYTDLVLETGVTDVDLMWGWYQDVVSGRFERRNGTIYVLDHAGVPAMWWNFVRAYPVSWTGPRFDASSSTVLTQSVTLTHEGLSKPSSSLKMSVARAVASGGINVIGKLL